MLVINNPDDYVMVGCDASGLEARMEAHYCYNFEGGKEYAYELLEGDVHKNNAVLFGLATSIEECTDQQRDDAKSPKYLLTYGGQAPKLRDNLGCSKKRSEQLFDNFWEGNTALNGFKQQCIELWKKRGGKNGGYLIGLDGRKIRTRSEHSLVNCMFQSAGSIVVKTACCYLFNNWIPKLNLDAHLVLHFHDEMNSIVHKDHAEKYAELASLSFVRSGEFWKLNVPLAGDALTGKNWSEIH
jgi:DNA polymerase I-like protein with 3'-5' exonuclease and polymerase domains